MQNSVFLKHRTAAWMLFLCLFGIKERGIRVVELHVERHLALCRILLSGYVLKQLDGISAVPPS